MNIETVGAALCSRLDVITLDIQQLYRFVHSRTNKTVDGNSDGESSHAMNNLEECVRSAEQFVSAASTIVGSHSTVFGGSVFGDKPNEEKLAMIDKWKMECAFHENDQDITIPMSSEQSGPVIDNSEVSNEVEAMLTNLNTLSVAGNLDKKLDKRSHEPGDGGLEKIADSMKLPSINPDVGGYSLASNSVPDSEDWEGKLSWIAPEPDSPLTVFHAFSEKPGSDWLVLHVIVNKANTRIVLLSCDDAQEIFSVKLYNLSGTVLWQRNDAMNSIRQLVLPAFTEDGKHLVVYIQGNAEIIDAQRATIVKSVSIEHLKPTAITIARNKNVAIATHKTLYYNQATLSRVSVPDSNGEATSISVVNLPHDNPRIVSLVDNRRLFIAGQCSYPSIPSSNQYYGFFFDARKRTLIQSIWEGGYGQHLDAPVYHITFNNEPCLVLPISFVGRGRHTSFGIYSADGALQAKNAWAPYAHTVVGNHVLGINQERRIQVWLKNDWRDVATIEGDDLPSFDGLKGLAVSENQITLIFDDEQFVYFGRD